MRRKRVRLSSWTSAKPRRLYFERCESRFALTSLGFVTHDLFSNEANGVAAVHAADIDGDGDADVVAIVNNQLVWAENRLAGDTDDDGDVDLADFVSLANSFGKTDAVWEDGDFDGDRIVDFSDFAVLAANFGNRVEQ